MTDQKEITEEQAREALDNFYTNGVPYKTPEAYNRVNIQLNRFSTFITRYFQMEKALKEIADESADSPAFHLGIQRLRVIAQQALIGKEEEK